MLTAYGANRVRPPARQVVMLPVDDGTLPVLAKPERVKMPKPRKRNRIAIVPTKAIKRLELAAR